MSPTQTTHGARNPYLQSPASVRYMARFNAQAPWRKPITAPAEVERAVPTGHGGKRVCRRLRHESGVYYESITQAGKTYRMSDATIRRCLDEGWTTFHGKFYDATEAEYQAWKASREVAA